MDRFEDNVAVQHVEDEDYDGDTLVRGIVLFFDEHGVKRRVLDSLEEFPLGASKMVCVCPESNDREVVKGDLIKVLKDLDKPEKWRKTGSADDYASLRVAAD